MEKTSHCIEIVFRVVKMRVKCLTPVKDEMKYMEVKFAFFSGKNLFVEWSIDLAFYKQLLRAVKSHENDRMTHGIHSS